MGIIRVQDSGMQATGTIPDGCPLTDIGTFRIPRMGGTFDRHFHDFDEYWLIYRGRAVVLTDDALHEVGPGDVVFTAAGVEHDIVRVLEDLEGFFVEDRTVGMGRHGHLHRDPALAAGHPVEP